MDTEVWLIAAEELGDDSPKRMPRSELQPARVTVTCSIVNRELSQLLRALKSSCSVLTTFADRGSVGSVSASHLSRLTLHHGNCSFSGSYSLTIGLSSALQAQEEQRKGQGGLER